MKHVMSVIAVCLLLGAANAKAATMQLDFVGDVVATFPLNGEAPLPASGTFSGQILLDTSVPDVRPEADNARYAASVFGGSVIWNDVSYAFTPGILQDAYVVNDSDVFNDLFAVLASFISADGELISFTFQLVDRTQSVFSSDAYPDFLDLTQFSDWDINDPNGTTALLLPIGGGAVQGQFDFVQLRPVPLPAAAPLLITGLLGLFGLRRRSSVRI